MSTQDGASTCTAHAQMLKAMLPAFDPVHSCAVALDVIAAGTADAAALNNRRARRLATLLSTAVERSPLYRQVCGRTRAAPALGEFPAMTKAELMARFDDWVTDRGLQLEAVRRFVADPACIAEPLCGRYMVWESSGSTGHPGLFVQDAKAMAVYDALETFRRPLQVAWPSLLDPMQLFQRLVFVGAIDGHFASYVSLERMRRLNPLAAMRVRSVSFLQPIQQIVAQVDAWSPTVLATYPSAAVMLAEEKIAGRLHCELQEVWTGGENLTPAMRRFVAAAFGCRVLDSYGASEFLALACECAHGRLHLNSDWAILESVDQNGQAVVPGTAGHRTLLTNLANHVQPIIRYDLGDRTVLHATPCACGSALPAIEVRGRDDDLLKLGNAEGVPVSVLPLALCTVLEEEAGLFDFQLCQLDQCELELRSGTQGGQAADMLARAKRVLGGYLLRSGAHGVRIRCKHGLPLSQGRSGKVQRVVGMS